MGLESALWEATRPAFRVRYIHDPTSTPRVPLYASYGFATGPTARAKLARIVRKAPEVVVKVTGRQRGGNHVKAHLDYIGRNLNQAMKAANASMLETGNKQIEPELRRIADMRMEISEQVTAVGDAMRGDASYWTAPD